MCWVMPPASPSVTAVSRIASSSEVLPWSTWPMITTTGGRVVELVGGVVVVDDLLDLVGGVDDLDLLLELVGEDLDRLVGQRLGERRHLAERHELLDDLRRADAEVLGDVLDGRPGADPGDVGALVRVLGDRRGDLFEDLAAAAAAAARRAAHAGRRDRRGRRGHPGHRDRGARPASR